MSFPLPPVLLSEAGFYGDPELWELGIYSEEDLKCAPKEELPMRFRALYASPGSFIDIPPNFMQGPPQNGAKPALQGSMAPGEPKKGKPFYRYARVKTQRCVDSELLFCETLAIVYASIREGLGDKVFLKGNVFLAKIAKAIFEQNGNLFAEACAKHKGDKYFRECADELEKLDFKAEKDKKIDKSSWLGLHETVTLLTGEYLATKCELPKVSASECKENGDGIDTLDIIVVPQDASEADVKEADLAPLELEKDGMYDSSDSIKAGELFHEFIAENFPFKDSEEGLTDFMIGIYGESISEALDEFCKDAASGAFPRPEIEIDAMEDDDVLGDHDGETIYINQRLALNSFSSKKPKDHFVLFVIMLIEYGHFLGDALREKAGVEGSGKKLAGRDFAYIFMKCSGADLLNSDFEFADFNSPAGLVSLEDRGEEQSITVAVSGLSREQREGIFYTLGTKTAWEGEV